MKRFLVPLTFGFLLIILLPLTQSRDDLITKTCKRTPSFQLCSSTLRSHPQSLGANVKGLSLILVHVAKAKATVALNHINNLKVSNPQHRVPLSKCSRFYNTVLSDHIPEAIQALSKGDHKAAEDRMSKSAAGAVECEKILKGLKRLPRVLIGMGKFLSDIFAIIRSIIKSLLGGIGRRHGSL